MWIRIKVTCLLHVLRTLIPKEIRGRFHVNSYRGEILFVVVFVEKMFCNMKSSIFIKELFPNLTFKTNRYRFGLR